jgi:hypothetical protein
MTNPIPNQRPSNSKPSSLDPSTSAAALSRAGERDADFGLDAALAARLNALAEAHVSPLAPPDAFVAAVARRREERRATRATRVTRAIAGLAIAAALILAGLAIRAAIPATAPSPNIPTNGSHSTVIALAADPSSKTRIEALRGPTDPPDLPAANHAPATHTQQRASTLRAGYSAALLRSEGRMTFR